MRRNLFYIGVIFLLLAVIAATPISVRAEGDPPPTPEPVKPPWITGINPQVSLAYIEEEELVSSGIALQGQGFSVPLMAPPDFVDLEPLPALDPSPEEISLAIPQFYQDPEDVTCGAAALGMALEFLSLNGEGTAPSQEALVGDLKTSGLLYETGTGVEELAYLARQYGYLGTTAFHNWSLEQLSEQLTAGKPVVVSLGLNGENQSGHFVTLTGISEDGSWVSYNDPVLGKQSMPADDFLETWSRQGSAGLVVHKEPLSVVNDPMLPWMGLFSAMAMLAVMAKQYPLGDELTSTLADIRGILSNPLRKGLAGKLIAEGGSSSAPRGYKWVKKTVPVFGWKDTKITLSRQVPILERKKILAGTRVWYKKVKRYRTVRVDEGYWSRRKVTKYRSERYVRYYRTTRVRKTRWVRRGWRLVKQTYYVTKRTPVYGTRRKPYTTYERYWKSKWVTKQVSDGYSSVRKEAPVYEYRMLPSGKTKTEYYTKNEKRYAQVGTEIKWQLKKDPTSKPPVDQTDSKEANDIVEDILGSGKPLNTLVVPEDVKESMPKWLKNRTVPPGFGQQEWDDYTIGFRKMVLEEYLEMWKNGEKLPTFDAAPALSTNEESSSTNDPAMPDWLLMGTKPPKFDDELWGSLDEGEKKAILRDYHDQWISGERDSLEDWFEKPAKVPENIWKDLDVSEKNTLLMGQNQDSIIMTIISEGGVNLRSSPELGNNIKETKMYNWNAYWNGEVKVDSQDRTWMYVRGPDFEGWIAWRNPNGEHLLEINKGSNDDNYSPPCDETNLCNVEFGKGHSWGDYHDSDVVEEAQYLKLRKLMKASGVQDWLDYPEVNRNLCGYIASAWAVFADDNDISLEEAFAIHASLSGDTLKSGDTYGMEPLEMFFNEFGYVTGQVRLSEAMEYDIAIIGVDFSSTNYELVDKDEKDYDGHWTQLIEYDPEMKQATIRDPFTGTEMGFGEGRDYPYDDFVASVWGSEILVAAK